MNNLNNVLRDKIFTIGVKARKMYILLPNHQRVFSHKQIFMAFSSAEAQAVSDGMIPPFCESFTGD